MRRLRSLALALLLAGCGGAQPPEVPTAPPPPLVHSAPAAPAPAVAAPAPPAPAVAAPVPARPVPMPEGFAPAELAFVVLDAASGTVLAEHNPERSLIPASTVKLITAAGALAVLGPAYRFSTELLVQGRMEDGTLEGDLVLRGGGDPLLEERNLLALATELRATGLRRVDGRLLVDDGALPLVRRLAPEQPEDATYNAGVSALSLSFNRLDMRRGDDGRLYAVPPPGGGDLAPPLSDAARGAVPVDDPALHAGGLFRRLAGGLGIELPVAQRGATPANARLVARHESPPLREIVSGMLRYSNNQTATLLGLVAARSLAGRPVPPEQAARLLADALARRLPDLPWQDALLVDQSGLAEADRLSPRLLAGLLAAAFAEGPAPALLPLMAGSGLDGTLSRRLDRPETALRVWAKTGTLAYATAVAGYLLPEEGRPRAFALLIADPPARARYLLQPDLAAADRIAAPWRERARALADALIECWQQPGPGLVAALSPPASP